MSTRPCLKASHIHQITFSKWIPTYEMLCLSLMDIGITSLLGHGEIVLMFKCGFN